MKNRFAEWVDRHEPAASRLLPLTHIAGVVNAQRIIDDGRISLPAKTDGEFRKPLVYLFYGRPAYRLKSGTTVQLESSCPCCFVFSPDLLARSHNIHAFDTGAFFNRLYSHVVDEDFKVEDFSLDNEPQRLNRLISATFTDEAGYIDADKSRLRKVDDASEAWELEGRAYLTLLHSPGRNEPDDRVATIEVNFQDPVPLDKNLLGVVVPHTLWNGTSKAPVLKALDERGVRIGTYRFFPGRHPEYLQAQLEVAAKELFKALGFDHEA
jgi:hypothetical protein